MLQVDGPVDEKAAARPSRLDARELDATALRKRVFQQREPRPPARCAPEPRHTR